MKDAKILIVDDQKSNVILLKDVLTILGYLSVDTITDSRQVMPYIISNKPDLLLLDLNMPYLSGYDIMEQIKTHKELQDSFMPILVLTADATNEAKERSLSEGASDFLTKPFELVEVGLRIKNLLTIAYLMSQLKNQNELLEEKVLERTKEISEKNYELTLAKNKAEESDRRYRLLFNANRDSITLFYIDHGGIPSRFINFNYAGAEILGYSRDELYLMSIFDLECDLTQEKLDARHNKLQSDGVVNFEATMITKDGRYRYMEIKAVLIDMGGRKTVMHIARDITERMEYIEAIQNQNKVLRDIAWTQSHVVRSPLARIMGVIPLINDKGADALSDEDVVKIIVDSANELDTVIKDISEKAYLANVFDRQPEK